MDDLPIIQKTDDLIKWYIPILNRLPRYHKFTLGERMITGLYDLLDSLIVAQYGKQKLIISDILHHSPARFHNHLVSRRLSSPHAPRERREINFRASYTKCVKTH